MSNHTCELCAEGYAQVTEVDLHRIPAGYAAIACTEPGFGHAAPRGRCDAIVAAALRDRELEARGQATLFGGVS